MPLINGYIISRTPDGQLIVVPENRLLKAKELIDGTTRLIIDGSDDEIVEGDALSVFSTPEEQTPPPSTTEA